MLFSILSVFRILNIFASQIYKKAVSNETAFYLFIIATCKILKDILQ